MKKIIIHSKTFGVHTVLLSDCDYKWASKLSWSIKKGHTTFYCKTRLSKTRWDSMHRLIKNAKKGEEIDHIDHNGLNNQRSNLRKCSDRQNSQNARKHIDNKCGFKGVSYDSRRDKYRARIFFETEKWLGYFSTSIEAATAYNVAAKKYFGKFAKLNIIQNGRGN